MKPERMLLGPLVLLGSLLLAAAAQAQGNSAARSPLATDTSRLRQHLRYLTTTPLPRNSAHPAVLDSVAAYLSRQLQASGARVHEQPYQVQGRTYRNVVASFGPAEGPVVVIGAHYDVCGNQPGADDNGTGIAALLELARQLGARPQLSQRLDLVAYTLEEPPFFRTPNMGSYVHAASLRAAGVPVRGMVALEMLGYYDDRRGSQHYPFGPLKLIYGSRGNYVVAARKFGSGRFARQFARSYRAGAALPVRRFTAPAWLPGIDFSDHLNYWKFGYSALLLTDTAFYRNRAYHETTDTVAQLDMPRLALAVDALLTALLTLRS
ncbi:M28 family peptidase [Hymenobacter sp. BT770]|uniref:M28 family peptidase n=1 Tax=Hymenobacter sp. BT770 TaxID=2886942 RepID=UPI001D12AF3D|nr:M28 family peptidase [Hymenobacter sp. BT770]MCC3153035.1 M28 family peptidase [Hymenobacter sp. BT770]MDO3415052.1 M28 family peptidase [Hymenobacter sp. BT770]